MATKDIKLGITIGADAGAALSAFADLKRKLVEQQTALRDAQAEASKLAKQLKETGDSDPNLAKSFEAAKVQASALKGEVAAGQVRLQGLRDALTANGVDAKNLAESMRRVKDEAKAAADAQKGAQALTGARDDLGLSKQQALSAQIDKTRAAYELLRNSGKLTGVELANAYGLMQNRVVELQAQTGGLAQRLSQVKESALALVAVLAGWAVAVKVAATFESAMVDFARATNQSKEAVMGLSDGFMTLGQKYGLSAAAIAGIATVGAKLGVARDDLNVFVEAVAAAAINFDMIPEEAGKALGTLSTLLKIPVAELKGFAGVINAVADGVGVMERDIVAALSRAGASAKDLGLSREQSVAMAASMIKLGADAEGAGSAMRTFSSRLRGSINDQGAAGAALKRLVGDVRVFAQLLYTDGQGAVNQFFAALARMPGPERFAILKDIFQEGLDTENINKLAAGTELYGKALQSATGDAQSFSSALTRLTDMRLGTTQSEFEQLKQAVSNLANVVGTMLLPVVRLVTQGLNGAATALRGFVQAMPLTAAMLGALATLAVGAGALRVALGAVSLLWARLALAGTAAMGALVAPMAGWLGRTVALQGAKLALGVALRGLLGPVGLVIAAVEVGIWAYERWGKGAAGAGNQADAAMRSSATAARTAMAEVTTQVDAAASVVSDRLTAAFATAKGLAESLGTDYKAAAQTIKAQYDQVAKGVDAALKVRLAQVKGNAQAEAQAVVSAEGEKLAAADSAAKKTLAAWNEAYGMLTASGSRWVSDEQGRAQSVSEISRTATQERLSALQEWESAYRQTVDRLIAEEQRHLGEVKRIETERQTARMSTEDRIRELARKGVDEATAFDDRALQVEQKQAAARVAIEQGKFELGKKLAEESMALAERNAVSVKQNGQEVVTQAAATGAAIAQIRESAVLVDAALREMALGHANAADAAAEGAQKAGNVLTDLSAQVVALQDKLATGASFKLEVDSAKFEASLAEIDALVAAKQVLLKLRAELTDVDAALAKVAERGAAGVDVKMLAKLEGLDATVALAKDALAAANVNVPLKFDSARAALADFASAAQSTLATPTESTHTVGSNVPAVRGEIDALNGRNTESTHTVYVRQVEQRAGGGLIGGVARLAKGGQALGQAWSRVSGRVFGPGTGTSDSVPAMLSANEFVVRAASVRRYGVGLLQAINSGRFVMGAGVSPGSAARNVAVQAAQATGSGAGAGAQKEGDQMRLLFEVPGRAPVRLSSARDKARDVVDMLRAAGLSVQVGPA